MKRARFAEEQIIGILKAAEAVGNIREACNGIRASRTGCFASSPSLLLYQLSYGPGR